MARGAGKFKTKRGGGRSFSRNLQLDENGTAVSMDRKRGRGQEESDSESGSEGGSDGIAEESESEEEAAAVQGQPELSRAERRELKKKQAAQKQPQKEGDGDEADDGDDDDILANPNRAVKKMNITDLKEPRQLSRKEREEKEKKEAKDRYWKLHVQGKTDEAKTDLARLAKIRAEREAAQAKRNAEAEERVKAMEARKAGAKR